LPGIDWIKKRHASGDGIDPHEVPHPINHSTHLGRVLEHAAAIDLVEPEPLEGRTLIGVSPGAFSGMGFGAGAAGRGLGVAAFATGVRAGFGAVGGGAGAAAGVGTGAAFLAAAFLAGSFFAVSALGAFFLASAAGFFPFSAISITPARRSLRDRG
jgi:hypothetical protein